MTGDESGKKQKKFSAPNNRDERLAAALRENLRRRKAQGRARGVEERGGKAQTGSADALAAAPASQKEKNR